MATDTIRAAPFPLQNFEKEFREDEDYVDCN